MKPCKALFQVYDFLPAFLLSVNSVSTVGALLGTNFTDIHLLEGPELRPSILDIAGIF